MSSHRGGGSGIVASHCLTASKIEWSRGAHIPESRLRVAIVGVGSWGVRAHLPALSACDGVDVVALVDPRTDVIEEAAARYRVPGIFRDVDTMLRQVDSLDAAVVATPTDAHHAVVMRLLDRGAHVLCEKPLAYTVPQAEEIAASVRARGRIGKMGFLFRCSPVVMKMKELIDQGYIGDVVAVESSVVNAQFVDPEKPLIWKMRRERASGGVYVEYGVHSIDLALWLGGPMSRVVAHGLTSIPRRPAAGGHAAVDVDDVSAWIAVYRSGGQALFRAGWASLPVGGGGLRVYGRTGSLAWQLDPTTRKSERLLVTTLAEPEARVLFEFDAPPTPQDDSGWTPLGLLAHYNARLDAGFIDDIRRGHPTGPTFDDGLAAQHVLAAIRTSLDEGRWADVGGA
ncbi:MAG: Gfo/Idh/MocA family protein [bacterium]